MQLAKLNLPSAQSKGCRIGRFGKLNIKTCLYIFVLIFFSNCTKVYYSEYRSYKLILKNKKYWSGAMHALCGFVSSGKYIKNIDTLVLVPSNKIDLINFNYSISNNVSKDSLMIISKYLEGIIYSYNDSIYRKQLYMLSDTFTCFKFNTKFEIYLNCALGLIPIDFGESFNTVELRFNNRLKRNELIKSDQKYLIKNDTLYPLIGSDKTWYRYH